MFTLFSDAVQRTNHWVYELREELEVYDLQTTYQILKLVLHTIRDQLSFEEATTLGASLPMPLRGAYYEKWEPTDQPALIENFKETVERKYLHSESVNFEKAIPTVLNFISQKTNLNFNHFPQVHPG